MNRNSSLQLSQVKNCFCFDNTTRYNQSSFSVSATLIPSDKGDIEIIDYTVIKNISDYFKSIDPKGKKLIYYCMKLSEKQKDLVINSASFLETSFTINGEFDISNVDFIISNNKFHTSSHVVEKIDSTKQFKHIINNENVMLNKRKSEIFFQMLKFESTNFLFKTSYDEGVIISDSDSFQTINNKKNHVEWIITIHMSKEINLIKRNYKTFYDMYVIIGALLKFFAMLIPLFQRIFSNFFLLNFTHSFIDYSPKTNFDFLTSSQLLNNSRKETSKYLLSYSEYLSLKFNIFKNEEKCARYLLYKKIYSSFRKLWDVRNLTENIIEHFISKKSFPSVNNSGENSHFKNKVSYDDLLKTILCSNQKDFNIFDCDFRQEENG